MKSEYSARRLLTNHPEQSIVPLRQAMLAAAELQHRAQDYKNSIDRPGGLPWGRRHRPGHPGHRGQR